MEQQMNCIRTISLHNDENRTCRSWAKAEEKMVTLERKKEKKEIRFTNIIINQVPSLPRHKQRGMTNTLSQVQSSRWEREKWRP